MYLPLLWEKGFCWKSPIVLGYTRGHFSALVAMETELHGAVGAGARIENSDEGHVTYLPLVDHERKLLPVHFLNGAEVSETRTTIVCVQSSITECVSALCLHRLVKA